ncbi:AAA family ATPase [Streptosporangium sp. NPDC002524]|uniref:AAA family ATPase n=1 Tax=Streptosporangium sp. NPDC002524 TaxID=3154537 RepID=UPI00332D8785
MTPLDKPDVHRSGPGQAVGDIFAAAAARGQAEQAAEEEPWPDEVPNGLEDQVNALIGELLDAASLDDLPALEPLVQDVLFLDTVTRIYGPSGVFKSFITLGLAGAVGTGMEWYGRSVRQGLVIYLVAEGAKGMRKRVRAWGKHHARKMTGVKFLPRPVQAMSPEWAVLIEVCRRLSPVLVIIDTQARVTVGVNENDNTEMGVVVDRMEHLRRVTGACVLIVHHSGHENADRGRGASAFKGGMQTELGVTRRGKGVAETRVTLSTGKQKDDEELPDQVFRLKLVELDGEAKEDGTPVTSVVLIPVDGREGPAGAWGQQGPPEGSAEWVVMQLDAARVPTDWGNRRVREACAEHGIKASNSKIEEAVRIRKNRTYQVPPHVPYSPVTLCSPDSGEHRDVFPGQTFPGNVGGTSGDGIPDARSPAPALKGGGTSEARHGKDGPLALCETCGTAMTKLTPDQIRHPMCESDGEVSDRTRSH